ncbi:MAG: RIP metalloprotease RseP [Sphaerochaetaceae bacterium]|nr:RIP metalloprotease RseP [Sphaerochaetaceae bacterium]
MNSLVSILIGFFAIATMITIHEAGHYLGARISHIEVEVFAIGWGKAIKRWYKNGTEYRINLFILGGYCKLKGTDDLVRSIQRDDSSFTTIEKGSLFAASPLKRIITYLAGPLQNLIFAALLFTFFFMLGYDQYSDPPRILLTGDYPKIYNTSVDSAFDGGLRSEDIITSIDGESISSFQQIASVVAEYDGDGPLSITVDRNREKLNFLITPEFDSESGRYLLGITNALEPVIDEIVPLSPEAVANMESGDTIVAVNGVETPFTMDVITQLIDPSSPVVTMKLQKTNKNIEEISYHPLIDESGNTTLNFSFQREIVRMNGSSFTAAVSRSIVHTITAIKDTAGMIVQLFTGAFSFSDSLAGPVRISYIIGEMRTAGLRAFLQLLAMISISLGVANLLPLPGLDGGSIILSLIELIRHRSFGPRMYVRFQTFGILILSILMIFVLFSDAKFFFM